MTGFFICLMLIAIAPIIYFNLSGFTVWSNCIKHCDEFAFDHVSNNKDFATFVLYDNEGNYMCEAFMNLSEKNCSIFCNGKIVGSSANTIMSKKVFKKLYARLPDEYVPNESALNPKKELLKKFKEMNKQ